MSEYQEKESVFNEKFDSFKKLLSSSRKTAVFTGAGVSTLSGIPDFRGKHGVYNSPWKGLAVEEILSIDYFFENPEIFYAWAEEVWYHLEDYEPNIVHYTLAKMENMGLLSSGIFTQNIDFMHQKAGSRKVYELQVPYCKTCKSLIKPDIVFYGEGLSADVLKRAEIAFSQADLTLILGSSLTVYPAAAFPQLTKYHGGKTVIVNAQPTDQDRDAELCFKDLEQFFSALNDHLDGKR